MSLLLFVFLFWNAFSISHQKICEKSYNTSVSSYFPNELVEYRISESDLCTHHNPDILIAVHSSPQNIDKRNAIRNTFGAFKRVKDKTIQLLFVIGISDYMSFDNISEESQHYRDIIQGNFVDSYCNLTLKHISLLNWVNSFCSNSSFLIKIDDDTMIDIFHLEYFLTNYQLNSDFYCKVIVTHVLRSGKWAVSEEEYPDRFYPPYCEGFAYILTNLTKLTDILKVSLNSKFFWIDDVLLLGNVRKNLNMTLEYFPNNFSYQDISQTSDSLSVDFMFFRNGANKIDLFLWKKVWNSILSNSIDLYL